MNSLFMLSAGLSLVGALLSLLLKKSEKIARLTACGCGMAAAAAGTASGVTALWAPSLLVRSAGPFPFADFSLLWNPLSGLLVAVISILALVACLYGLSYFSEYSDRGVGSIGFFLNLFILSMQMVVLVDNAFWFLIFFELMSLTSYFLVVVDQSKQSLRGGFLYFVMAHIGFMLIMISFLVMSYAAGGSFEFSDFRQLSLSPVLASIVFALAFLGFGIKAGMVPFHSWLPQAHPAAPSNVSALMSGGMVKIGIFGIVKVCFDLLGASGGQLWWGIIVIVFGAVSAVLGILYATDQHDIKKILAYCTVENVGIMLIGIGAALCGAALDLPLVTALGLAGALYHLVNHALFKGALFLGAGSVLYRVHSRSIDAMGGLARAMPWTAALFLAASLAVCAIPPLNGFASEWVTYQALINAAISADAIVKSCAVFAAAALALTGALAVVCFVKTYGVAFSGAPRSHVARDAREVPLPMVAANVVLVVACVALGLGAAWIAPVMQGIASATLGTSAPVVATGAVIVNVETGAAAPLLFIAALGLVLVLILRGIQSLTARRLGVGWRDDPWDCGYMPETSMLSDSRTFSAHVKVFFGALYAIRTWLTAKKDLVIRAYQCLVRAIQKVEPVGDRFLVDGVVSLVGRLGRLAQKMEGGDFRIYISYIVVALVFFLILAVVY